MLWENDESDLWDRGRPSPALVTFLEEHPYRETLFRDRAKRQLKAFVPVNICSRAYKGIATEQIQGMWQRSRRFFVSPSRLSNVGSRGVPGSSRRGKRQREGSAR
jgi:hypothetical protein